MASEHAPGALETLLAAGQRHHRAGRVEAAERAYRQALDAVPDHPGALHLLGVLAGETGRFEEAVPLLERAVERAPGNSGYRANLARALACLGRDEDAVEAFAGALELGAERRGLLVDLAQCLRRLGRLDEAQARLQRALELDPDNAAVLFHLGAVQRNRGRLAEAVISLESSLALEPRAPRVAANLAAYRLEHGDARGALEAAEHALALAPRHTLALALRAVALERLGERRAAGELLGLGRLIRPCRIAAPPGYPNLEAFNRALAEAVLAEPTLHPERSDLATRLGRQTGELQGAGEGPLASFEAVVDQTVARYLEGLPSEPAHPYLAARPSRWRLVMWAVVLGQQGHQIAHIHGDGWVSGVYYVQLPEAIAATGDPAGWIEFGRPPPEFGVEAPATRLVQPQAGTMLLFPSYVYHRTIPFASDTPRISIAFDALPQWS